MPRTRKPPRLQIDVSEDTRHKLRVIAALRDQTQGEVIETALLRLLEQDYPQLLETEELETKPK